MNLLSFEGNPGDYTIISYKSSSTIYALQQVEFVIGSQTTKFETLVEGLLSPCLNTATSKAYYIVDTNHKSEPMYLELYQGKIMQVSMISGHREEVVKNEFTVDDMRRIEDASHKGILCGSCNPFYWGDGAWNAYCRGLNGSGCKCINPELSQNRTVSF